MANYYVLKTVKVLDKTSMHLVGTVEGVPTGTTNRELVEALDAAGLAPVDEGIPWANHLVRAVDRMSKPPIPTLIPRPVWTWDELIDAASRPVLRQLNVRIPVTLYRDCEAAAMTSGVNLRKWVESVLTDAVSKNA